MSLRSSSKEYPTANFAAIFAIGKPVALEANAELLETRGFISITIILPSFGFTANWIFEPPVSTPISRMTAKLASRISWYSLSVRVNAGATVMESPVCTPMGSKFSMEQITTHWSLWSRITSISNSFHPSRHSSTRTSDTGDALSPNATIFSYSSRLYAIPPPVPPKVKLGRIITGNLFQDSIQSTASFISWTVVLWGMSKPIFSMASRKSWRSSPFSIASCFAPISSTPYFSSIPRRANSKDRLRPVCPPSVGRRASGRSLAIIFSRTSGVSGSI
ncbi:unknown [Coraliomargarita sp. CAG:312]|nr:unknown [Coraliomargarita sp. CAG:312]